MPSSDRAFRALARAQPGVIAELLRVLVPGSIPAGAMLTPHHVEDSRLDASSYLEDADWLVRVGDEDLDHVECQGYRDSTFPDRVFRYHIRILRESGATHYQRWMAVVVATMRGRYSAMVLAMKMESMEPIVIEDLVKFGEDRGYDRGWAAGLELLRGALLDVLGARAIPVGPDELARIALEASPEQLREWSRRAATATAAGEVFLD